MGRGLFRRGDRPWLHLLLLALTLASVFYTYYTVFTGNDSESFRARLLHATAFSLAVIGILGSHEMGHYLMARYHRVDSSLPFFIPLPLVGLFGTLGAVIRIRDRIPHRNALVDIGAAGPLCGLLVAIPVLAWGIHLSTVAPQTVLLASAFPEPGSLWGLASQLASYLTAQWTGTYVPPEPAHAIAVAFGPNLLTVGLQRWIVGPLGPGLELRDHPLAIAGWLGLLVTMLNLVPLGQLDGGHLAFATLGSRARRLGQGVALGMAVLCLFFSAGWLVWLVVTTKVIGFGHPAVVDPTAPLSKGRLWACVACAVALLLCLMPMPLTQVAIR